VCESMEIFRVYEMSVRWSWSFLWKRHTDIYKIRKPKRLRQKPHACHSLCNV